MQILKGRRVTFLCRLSNSSSRKAKPGVSMLSCTALPLEEMCSRCWRAVLYVDCDVHTHVRPHKALLYRLFKGATPGEEGVKFLK